MPPEGRLRGRRMAASRDIENPRSCSDVEGAETSMSRVGMSEQHGRLAGHRHQQERGSA